MIQDLVKKLLEYKDQYYKGNPSVSDDEFDSLEKQLKQLDPNNSYFNLVGSKEDDDDEKVNYTVPMLSMQKVKDAKSAQQWMFSMLQKFDKAPIDIQKHYQWPIQPKIDGVSCCIRYNKNGRFEYMSTRGNGNQGSIIKYGKQILEYNKIPLILYEVNNKDDYDLLYGRPIELRGELYINQYTEKIPKPLRNNLAGIIKRKELTPELQEVKVCLYQVVDAGAEVYLSYGDYFPSTIDPSITVKHYTTYADINTIELVYDSYNKTVRQQFPFETDGLVIYAWDKSLYLDMDHAYSETSYHYYNLALKPPSKSETTTVKNINYNVSRFRQLIPVVEVEPIQIDNRTITNFSMTNWDNLMQKQIKINSCISVQLANDVIPMLKIYYPELSKNEIPIKPPTVCPACGCSTTKIGKNFICDNIYCNGANLAFFETYLKNMEIKGLASEGIKKLQQYAKIKTLEDLYKSFFVTKSAFEILGEKTAEKIKDSMQKTLYKLNSQTFLAYAANIPMLGLKQVISDPNCNDIESFFHSVQSNPNSAVKRSVYEWLKDEQKVQTFYSFVHFIETLKT